MIQPEEAASIIAGHLPAIRVEEVSRSEAQGHYLAEPLKALLPLPRFDNSAMDGYAVVASDLRQASAQNPVPLRCIGEVAAGSVSDQVVMPGTCMRIFTGSQMPPGANAVLMQEDTRAEGGGETINCLDRVKPFEHVRLQGEDVSAGSLLLAAGTFLGSRQLALAASAGCERLRVGLRPSVAVIATGDELSETGDPGPGCIPECNRGLIAASVRAAGGEPHILPLVRDDLDSTVRILEEAMGKHDVVITSGGVSVGDHDHVKEALQRAGGTLRFWKVAMKPGKPFVFGSRGQTLVFGLPGNPVSAAVTFQVLVRPALLRLAGAGEQVLQSAWIQGLLGSSLSNPGDRAHYMRVARDQEGAWVATGLQASHGLLGLGAAEGLVRVPPSGRLEAGEWVKILPLPVD